MWLRQYAWYEIFYNDNYHGDIIFKIITSSITRGYKKALEKRSSMCVVIMWLIQWIIFLIIEWMKNKWISEKCTWSVHLVKLWSWNCRLEEAYSKRHSWTQLTYQTKIQQHNLGVGWHEFNDSAYHICMQRVVYNTSTLSHVALSAALYH